MPNPDICGGICGISEEMETEPKEGHTIYGRAGLQSLGENTELKIQYMTK